MTLEAIVENPATPKDERDMTQLALDLLEAGKYDPAVQEYLTARAKRVMNADRQR